MRFLYSLTFANMKLLVITQKADINDDILGFFHSWLFEFSKKCESVIALCLERGQYDLPANVKVLSLEKEKFKIQNGTSSSQTTAKFKIPKKFIYLINFYRYIWQERKNYDAVFVHMNPIYIVLGGAIWRMLGKKVGLWYTHKAADWKLRIAEKLADKIFTASKESFRLLSKKVVITGHGIDTNKFQISSKIQDSSFKIISVGRVAPVKNIHILIEVAEILRNKNFNFGIEIAGAPILEQDKIYFEKLKNLIKEKKLDDKIIFTGSIPYKNIAEFYQNGDLFINLSDTGSIDKAILEAMASGLQILTSNEAFKAILSSDNITDENPQNIASSILALATIKPNPNMRKYVLENHQLRSLINNLILFIK